MKLRQMLKGISIATLFCGVLSLGFLFKDQTNHRVEMTKADDISQIFTIYDSQERVGNASFYNDVTSASCNFNYKYRYYLLGQKNSNGVMTYKSSTTIQFIEDGSYATDISFLTQRYVNPVITGYETFSFVESTWHDSMPNNASFYIMAIQDGGLEYDKCDIIFDLTNTIQGDYWDTWTIQSMFTQDGVNTTGSLYQYYLRFPYDSGNNRLLLFDLTSELQSIDIFDIYYQQGYANGYQNGYNEGYNNGENSAQESAYSEGYSVGASVGYQEGYSDGIEQGSFGSEQYYNNGYQAGYSDGYTQGSTQDEVVATIFSGILQVAMVPINFFLAIFNFEILGINLSGFITALFTIALTIIVIRTIFGGKGGNGDS